MCYNICIEHAIYTERVCSTIRSKAAGEVTILQATFISPVAGTIYFRQSGSEPAVIHGSLFWVDGTSTAASVEWTLYDDLVRHIKACQWLYPQAPLAGNNSIALGQPTYRTV